MGRPATQTPTHPADTTIAFGTRSGDWTPVRLLIATVSFFLLLDVAIADVRYELVLKIENPAGPIEGGGDQFGISLAQVEDRIVIGAYRDDTGAENAGAAYVFNRHGGLLETIHNPTPEPDDWFAFEVSSVGSRILIAARNDDTAGPDSGSVYLYNQQGNLLTTITNPNPNVGDDFGQQVLAVGDKILVTASQDDTTSINAGAAYLFDQDGNLLKELFSPNPIGYNFGRSATSIGDNRVLISAYREPLHDLTDVGAAYLFDLEGNLLQTFPNPDPADNDWFGVGVTAIGDQTILISANEHLSRSSNRGGRAYLFDLDGEVLATILNPTPASQDWFGRTLTSVGNEHVLIGAIFDDTLEHNAGAAYLYDSTGNLVQTFLPPEPVPDGHFGQNLGTFDDLILIGSDFDGGFTGPGAVYVYAPVSPLPGDFNNDLIVDQGDLDLVLGHWGADGSLPPAGWVGEPPSGLVDQTELDKVLTNWGARRQSEIAAGNVPEPNTVQLAIGLLAVAGGIWTVQKCRV